MKFKTINEAYDRFFPYKDLELSDFILANEGYWTTYKEKPNMGEWLLFRHVTDGAISRPILGFIVGHTVWDQALVLEYCEEWRAWHKNAEILNKHVGHYYPIAANDKKVKKIQFWTNDIKVLGHWKTKPSFRELRNALKDNQ